MAHAFKTTNATADAEARDLIARHGVDGASKLVRGKLMRLRRKEAADGPNRTYWGDVLHAVTTVEWPTENAGRAFADAWKECSK